MKEYTVLEGPRKGPTTVIMAGVHGNETCGIKAIETLIPILQSQILLGKVIFLLGNPLAISEGKRFIDTNLNRMFINKLFASSSIKDSYECHRAKFLMSVLSRADALLDIHSTRNKSEPFVLSDNIHVYDYVDQFPKQITRVVSGIDELHKGSSDGFMNSIGNIGICIECGQHEDKVALQVAKGSIYRFLHKMGQINLSKKKVKKIERQSIHLNEIYFTKTNSFKLSRIFDDFTLLKKGDLIGVDGTREVKAKKDCVIVFAINRNKKGEEGFILGEILE